MTNESPLHSRLLDLLSKKDFEALSSEEKEFTLSQLSETEYNSLRSFHRKVETTFLAEKNTAPESYIKKSLDKAFEKKYSAPGFVEFLHSLMALKIPAYQAAMGCVVTLLLASWYFHYQTYTLDSSPLLAVADTVFIERQAPAKTDTIYLTQKETLPNLNPSTIRKQNVKLSETATNATLKEIGFPEQNMIYITDFKNIRVPGSTIREDSLPREFMVGIL